MLGGLSAEELTDQPVLALVQGFGGIALQQLAGLVRPAQRDLGNLPERAFAEMGLEPIDRNQAVTLVIVRGELSTCDTISTLLNAFPDFSERWRKHVAWWGGKPAGSYNDICEFVRFTLEQLYEKGNLKETRRVFELLEKLFVEGDQEIRDLIGLGFFEPCGMLRPGDPTAVSASRNSWVRCPSRFGERSSDSGRENPAWRTLSEQSANATKTMWKLRGSLVELGLNRMKGQEE
jgi:hypothetical protein